MNLHLQHLRGQRDDLHESLLTQFAADRPEDAGPARVVVGLDDHRGVLVELDVAAVGTPALLDGTHHDGLDDVTAFDVAARNGVLDGGDDDVTDAGVPSPRTAEHPDAQDFLGTGVVGNLQPRFLLNHPDLLNWFTCARQELTTKTLTCAVFVTEEHAGPTSLHTPAEVCSRQPLESRGRPAHRKIPAVGSEWRWFVVGVARCDKQNYESAWRYHAAIYNTSAAASAISTQITTA